MKHSVLILLLFAIALLAGCTGGAQLTVVNRSEATLSNVVVSGTGFSESYGTIAPGEQKQRSVNPRGESGVRLEFDANGRHFSSGPEGYFEGSSSYRVTVTVAPDFSARIETKIAQY